MTTPHALLDEYTYAPASNYDGLGKLNVLYGRSKVDVTVPRSLGSLTREASTRSILVPEQFTVELNDVICLPRQVLLQGEKILLDSFRRGNPQHPHAQLDQIGPTELRLKMRSNPHEVIEEPCFYFDGEHVDHFGHFVLEVVSRLWPFKLLDLKQYLFVTSAKEDGRVAQLLAPFGVAENQIRYFRNPILCRKLIVASQSYILEGSVSPEIFAVWDKIGDFYDDGRDIAKIYVSRAKWGQQRSLINEKEIESAIMGMGFEVIHPQEMAFAEQVRTFRNARTIVGPSGSGFYNCIFARQTGARAILASSAFVTINDGLINTHTKSEITYLTGDPVEKDALGMLANWTIDSSFVLDFVATL